MIENRQLNFWDKIETGTVTQVDTNKEMKFLILVKFYILTIPNLEWQWEIQKWYRLYSQLISPLSFHLPVRILIIHLCTLPCDFNAEKSTPPFLWLWIRFVTCGDHWNVSGVHQCYVRAGALRDIVVLCRPFTSLFLCAKIMSQSSQPES